VKSTRLPHPHLNRQEKGHGTNKSIKAIRYFSESELTNVRRILRKRTMEGDKDLFLIDARRENKTSASIA
jgi:hypothetical protein